MRELVAKIVGVRGSESAGWCFLCAYHELGGNLANMAQHEGELICGLKAPEPGDIGLGLPPKLGKLWSGLAEPLLCPHTGETMNVIARGLAE